MKGLELAEAFFNEYGKPMLARQFGDVADRIAVGLVGHGSECFGFDDDLSKDHDFEPGFCLWLTEQDEADFGFRLFRAYEKLPKEFMGITRQQTSLMGGNSRGVQTISGFYGFYLGQGDLPQTNAQWLRLDDFYLAEATNGKVFCDPLGEFSRIRKGLKENCPEDVWLAKLADAVLRIAQSGQYNYARCMAHGQKGAAAWALQEFVRHGVHGVYLLNRAYMPYYKWAFKGMEALAILGDLAEAFTELAADPMNQIANEPKIEAIAQKIAAQIRAQGLSERTEDYLEPYAYCIKNKIKDGMLRNSSVLL